MNQHFETIRLRVENGIAHLTLAGDAGNPIGAKFGRDIRAAAIAIDQAPDVRVVLVAADGDNFCVGGDIRELAGYDDLASAVKSMTSDYHAGLAKLLRMNAPIVTAVQGAVAGAGVAFAALGDIVYAAASSSFSIAYTGIGFSPDGATSFLLPRLIGMRRFQELALTNRRVRAPEAAQIGLITEMVDDGALAERALATATMLANGPTLAYGATRRLLLDTFSTTLETQLEWEARLLSDQCRHGDVGEGMRAFAERRRPAFQGR